MSAALLGVFLVLAILAERRGNLEHPWIDLLTGCALIAAGVWTFRDRRVTGLLLLAAALSWFLVTADLAGGWSDELVYAHRGLLVGSLLAACGLSVPVVVAVAVACGAAFDYERANSTGWLAATGLTALAAVGLEARRGHLSRRYAAAAAASIGLWSIVPGVLAPHELLYARSRLIVYSIGVVLGALTVALARTRVLQPAAIGSADIIRDGGPVDVLVAFREPGHPHFEDVDGRRFVAAAGRNVARAELGDDLGEALVSLPTAVDPARATADLSTGLRLLAANRRALQVVRTQAGEVAASERRIREADDHAAAQVGLELDRLVVRRIDQALDLLGDGEPDNRAALLDVLAEVRALAGGLVPPALDRGLRAALVALAAEQPVPVDVDVVDVWLSPEAARTLYFAAAECLTNAARHASASRLELSLAVVRSNAELTVGDNGRGGAAPVPGGGLAGLSSRLAALGGQIEIRANGEGGTVITASLPLDECSADAEPQPVS